MNPASLPQSSPASDGPGGHVPGAGEHDGHLAGPSPLASWSSSDVCQLWSGSLDRDGYGTTSWRGRSETAHRVTWIKAYGQIPSGMEIDHTCNTRACITLEHLEAVSHAENMRRAAERRWSNRTHCTRGHDLAAVGIYVSPRGKRECRACRIESHRPAPGGSSSGGAA